ncbi:PRKR-interacting protein 1 [Trichinella spiralis]|uniref:PRKR-interacting protein 1 n=1 Tax=Trichinella spiralis TaxID=6334 RepID=UPI0001EFC23C|nr:PRKR-interacting protein 1 [Trichinella spiralis]
MNRRRFHKDDDDDDSYLRGAKTAMDEQRRRLEKLLQNIEKPAYIPEKPKEWKPEPPPEFVRNVVGSSAGAGSGEYHIYRNIRKKENERLQYIEQQAIKQTVLIPSGRAYQFWHVMFVSNASVHVLLMLVIIIFCCRFCCRVDEIFHYIADQATICAVRNKNLRIRLTMHDTGLLVGALKQAIANKERHKLKQYLPCMRHKCRFKLISRAVTAKDNENPILWNDWSKQTALDWPLLSEKELKSKFRGAFDFRTDTDKGIIEVRWFDNRLVTVMSTYLGIEPKSSDGVVKREK